MAQHKLQWLITDLDEDALLTGACGETPPLTAVREDEAERLLLDLCQTPVEELLAGSGGARKAYAYWIRIRVDLVECSVEYDEDGPNNLEEVTITVETKIPVPAYDTF